ncbi:hypothetical protein BT96DRAFT_928785 [Gymnopus androsaceus JB14]|uniref:Uncharacterized protein n=1 Tax=Gymnopus androsaceus JB14 TaxID=1447944 RepID=A0A6A4GIT1_9AGAR|nr:hypothetical protein BT96DRAFT_928785 [Gymnopus androsaceus JB14]
MSAPIGYSLPRLVLVMTECTLYGAYVILFGLAVWLLPQKFHIPSVKKFIFPSIIALFAFATLNIAYNLAGEAYAIVFTIPEVEKPWMIAGQSIDSITFIFADILGDLVLFYRVYAVWGYRKRVLFPVLLLIGSIKVLGILAAIVQIHLILNEPPTGLFGNFIPSLEWIFEIVNAFSNMLMTLMIAGRVWWLSRSLQKELPSGVGQSHWYHRAVAVVTESGIIYPVYLTIDAILSSVFNLPSYVCMGTITVGIAPTLIAVRVGLGSAVDDQTLRSSIVQSDLLFAARPAHSAHALDIVVRAEDISTSSSIPNFAEDLEKRIHST